MKNQIPNRFSRSALIFSDAEMQRIFNARVAVFGIGGVGGHAAEALARAGVGSIDLIDADTVEESNINRQAVALTSALGLAKVDVMRQRILDINPHCRVNAIRMFYSAQTADEIKLNDYDYILDAIDTLSAKIELIERAERDGVKIISAMGAGNKLDATAFTVDDIYNTSVCPLARAVRTALKKRGIKQLKVVYSKEPPIKAQLENPTRTPGSVSFVPPVVGLIQAGEAIKDIAYGIKPAQK